jgi:YYY domain-containing protein
VIGSIVAWWLAAEVLGLMALPICYVVFRGLSDRGLGFAKIAGLLLLGYITWLVEILQFVDFSRATVLVFLVLLAAGGAWLVRKDWPDLLVFVSSKRKLILGYEAIFAAAFLFMVIYRGFNPEISGTEKPMDFALIEGILRSGQFPPKDPWMSGFSISYYYFGYYLSALMIRISGVMPAIGFNLALGSFFALTAQGVASLLYNLTNRLRVGVLGAFLVLIASNADGLLRVIHYGTLTPSVFWWWWPSSRVLISGCNGQCIDEFPQFSFMLGDLHPHVMVLPLAVLALGIALTLLKRPEPLRFTRVDWLTLLVVPVAVGSLGFTNTWDLPAYLAIVLTALVARQYVGHVTSEDLVILTPSEARGKDLAPSEQASSFAAAAAQDDSVPMRLRTTIWLDLKPILWVAIAAIVAYLPFYVGFQSQAGGIRLVQGQTTPAEFFGMWGFPFAAALALLAVTVRLPRRDALALAVGGIVIEVLTRKWLVALMLPLAAAALWHLWLQVKDRKWDPVGAFALGLAAAGFGLIAVCEVVFLKDTFNNRMNTIFKFYYEAWLFLAIAAAYGIYAISQRFRTPRLHYGWTGAVAVVCAALCVYPVASFYSKGNEFKPAWTLDGSAFLTALDKGDGEAVTWLNDNVHSDKVVAEATGDEYTLFGRIATYTGLQSILGWAGHELQWRGTWIEQPKRIGDLATLYTTTDQTTVQNLLKQYNVSFVVVGGLERQKYGSRDYNAVFQKIGKVVFNQDGTTLYQVGAAS